MKKKSNDKLQLLSYAKDFQVIEKEDGYEVLHIHEELSAFIDNENNITYYVTGVYNSGLDWVEIDVSELNKLKQFCELMIS